MRDRIRNSDLLKLTAILVFAALGCGLLYALRALISRTSSYSHLIWNLVLAIVPYLISAVGSMILGRMETARSRALAAIPVASLWLLFYPNAPYIFTDFIHVFNRTYLRAVPSEWLGLNALIWYDIVMNAAFAFIGHFIGLVSMWLVQDSLKKAWGKFAARALVLAAILLSGFGIYLGRFSRLNSWDVIADPLRVLGEVAEAVSDPKAILFSLAFALFIVLCYASLTLFKRLSPSVD